MRSDTPKTLCWAHIGDLHLTTQAEQNFHDFEEIVAQINATMLGKIDFVVLPGDNADDGTAAQYQLIEGVLRQLEIPVFLLPGDHDFKPRSLDAFHALSAARDLPFSEVISGFRCLFLDIVSAGSGGPDFRLGASQRQWLKTQLGRASQNEESVVVFMHAYPADLKEDAMEVARLFADNQVLVVDMGHTHYNEISNDGVTVFMTTRSTGQIEEGPVGYSIGCIEDSVVSWRFNPLKKAGPVVLITQPCDIRLLTMRSAEHRTGKTMQVAARVFSSHEVLTCEAKVDDGAWISLADGSGPASRWFGTITRPDREFELIVRASDAVGQTTLESIVVASAEHQIVDRVLDGSDANAVVAWHANGLLGTQLGPNKNGRKW